MASLAKPRLTSKVWPSGDFTVGLSSNPNPVKLPPPVPKYDLFTQSRFGDADAYRRHLDDVASGVVDGRIAPLGSSMPVISHKPRAKRGSKGITSWGKKMVRSAITVLQRRYGKDQLSFATLTLPSVTAEQLERIIESWAEITRRLFQEVKRFLEKRSLPAYICGVTEIQELRSARFGGVPLHLHFVFVGRKRRTAWAMTPLQLRKIWRRCLSSYVSSTVSFDATENIVRVRKDAASYLGKYLSKGCKAIQKLKEQGVSIKLPSSWWNCSLALRQVVLRLIKSSTPLAKYLMDKRMSLKECGFLAYFFEITFTGDSGKDYIIGLAGRLSRPAMKALMGSRLSLDNLSVHLP